MTAYHVAEHDLGVIVEILRFRHIVYHRYLLPSYQAETIAHLQNGIILRIMTDTYEIGSHILYHFHIPTMHLVIEGNPHWSLILMTTHAAKLIRLSIEQEAPF